MSAISEAFHYSGAALVASLLVALTCALLGVHVVARRLVTVGLALPQMAALGIALSFRLAGPDAHEASGLRHEAFAFAMELAAAAVLAWSTRGRSLGQDALAGVLFVAGMALTVLVLTQASADPHDIKLLVEGDILLVKGPDLARLVAVLAPIVAVLVLGGRRLLFCTFDRETASTLGVRAGRWEALFYGMLAATVAAGVHAAGPLFVFAYLVLPGAAGIAFGRSAAGVFVTAATTALIAAFGGFVLSYAKDWPTGYTCAATALALFLVCAGAGAARGRIAAAA